MGLFKIGVVFSVMLLMFASARPQLNVSPNGNIQIVTRNGEYRVKRLFSIRSSVRALISNNSHESQQVFYLAMASIAPPEALNARPKKRQTMI